MDLSFSGAGFMGCYYFGVVNCWDKYIPRERVRRVAGASAGSLIAAYYLMDLPLEKCLNEIIGLTEHARSLPLGVFDRSNQIVDVLPRALDKIFPEDAHKRVNGRLYVSMTRLKDFKSVVVNEFETRQDLIDALNCSCFIPVWSGNHVSTFKGVKYIDGGFSNNLPVFEEHTIRVSCFSGASDIAPYDQARMELLSGKGNLQGLSFDLSWKNLRRGCRALWPPPAIFIAELLKLGFHDTKEFILDNDLIQCDRCFRATKRELQPIYSHLTPTISPAASPSVSRAPSSLNLSSLDQKPGDGGGKLRDSKRRARKLAENLPPIRIKEHRLQAAAGCQFETNRNKSGKKIGRKALERLRSDADLQAAAEDDYDERHDQKSGFANKLREKLQQVATAKSAPTQTNECDMQKISPTIKMPTIVIEAPASNETTNSAEPTVASVPESAVKIEPASKTRTSSLSSNSDSALGLESSFTPKDGAVSGLMASSPAEKFLAGIKQRAQSLSTADSAANVLLASQLTAAGRFSSAPSPLPSCPPSPNLNRHCMECIRLRQQARTDELDESIAQAAEHYSKLSPKNPEREFNSFKWKLACWLRQFGPPKYSYSFQAFQSADDPTNLQTSSESDDSGDQQTMAELKARRKATHPFAWLAETPLQTHV